MKIRISNLLAIIALVMVTGCATSRSVLSVNSAPSYNTANPAEGVAVKLQTTDAREFQTKPPSPDIPSLKDGDIYNQATTSRAIARKRNGYGKALGDVLLPEGQTVATIVQDAVAASFRQAGYRVLRAGEPGFEQAVPVDIRIKQYWSWVSLGFWAGTMHCRAEVVVKAPLTGLESGLTTEALAEKSVQAAFESDWQDISSQGLTNLTTNLASKLPRQTAAK